MEGLYTFNISISNGNMKCPIRKPIFAVNLEAKFFRATFVFRATFFFYKNRTKQNKAARTSSSVSHTWKYKKGIVSTCSTQLLCNLLFSRPSTWYSLDTRVNSIYFPKKKKKSNSDYKVSNEMTGCWWWNYGDFYLLLSQKWYYILKCNMLVVLILV